jgi:hypothetical protein
LRYSGDETAFTHTRLQIVIAHRHETRLTCEFNWLDDGVNQMVLPTLSRIGHKQRRQTHPSHLFLFDMPVSMLPTTMIPYGKVPLDGFLVLTTTRAQSS